MPVLLVVDDEPLHSAGLSPCLSRRRPGSRSPPNRRGEGLAVARQRRPDVVILDVQLPDQSGLEVFRRLRELDARTPVVLITGKATTDTAIEAMKLGAYDYLFKPLELPSLRQVIEQALAISRMMHVPAVVAETEPGRRPGRRHHRPLSRHARGLQGHRPGGGPGRHRADHRRERHRQGAGGPGDLPAQPSRAAAPFLAINCAALPETLLESELFGHEKGAFTGADRQRIGKFEQCSGGTLFLDEVGDMSPLTQSKVLRLLQEQQFERLGGNETIHADVRVLAATNQDLKALMEQGRFRKDLYYRLNVFTIWLPPLRDRGDDLTLLVQHYLRRFSRELGKDMQTVAPEALALLQGHAWPGNVRELQSVLKQAMLQATGAVLLPDFLPAGLRDEPGDLGGTR